MSWPFGFGFDFAIPILRGRRGPSYDPDAASIMSRMTAQLSKDDKAAINQFFVTMKSDGTFGQCDGIYWAGAFKDVDGLQNWRQNAYNLDNSSAIPNVFKTRRGYTGATNSTTKLDSGFNPTTAPGCKFTQNSAFMAVYLPNNLVGKTNRAPLGESSANSYAYLHPYYTDGSVYAQINGNAASFGPVNTRAGLTSASRTSATSVSAYRNGVKLSTQTSASVPVSNANFYVGACNTSGSVTGSNDTVSFAAWGGALTDSQHATLNTAVQTFMAYLASKYSTEVWTYLDQIVTDVQQQTAYAGASYADWYANDIIEPLKAKNIWATGDKCHIVANYDAQAAQRNAIKPLGPMSPVNAPTFTKDRGYAGNGTSSYLTDGVSASTMCVNASQNNNAIAAYINTSRAAGNNASCVWSSHSFHNIYGMLTSPLVHRARTLDSGVGPGVPMAVADAKGFAMGNRTAANSNRYVKNGVLVQDAGEASAGPPTSQPHFMCALSNGAPAHYSTDRIAFTWTGAGLTQQQEADFYNIVQAALTKIGAQAA